MTERTNKANESESARVRRLFLDQIRGRKLPVPRSKAHPDGEVVFLEGEVVQRYTKAKKLKSRSKSPGWSFDFAWPEQLVAVEVEGVSVVKAGKMMLIGGRHGTISGFKEDCEKYAYAAVQGWRVMRFEQSQVRAGVAIDMLVRMFAALEVLPALVAMQEMLLNEYRSQMLERIAQAQQPRPTVDPAIAPALAQAQMLLDPPPPVEPPPF